MRGRWTVLILLGIMLCLLAREAQANIILKTLVVNPSRTKSQTAVLKAYLPEEVKPEDVVDLGDLKIDYDIGKALYYVYQEFELAPGESVSRSIEIKDIWLISQAELDTLTKRAKELMEALKKTTYFDTAVILQKDIQEKAGEVLDKQERAMDALPQTHIAAYRENVEDLDSIKMALVKLENMLIESKISKGGLAGERVSVKATWWLILGVVVALGLLSLAFFIIWHRQATITTVKQKAEEEEEAKATKEPPRPPEEERRKKS